MTTPLAAPRVLIIDDEEDLLRIYRLQLAQAGITDVHCFQSAAEALEMVTQNTVDLILLDLSLNGESGQDYLQHLKEKAPRIPVIIITGNQQIDTAVACMKAGAYNYLTKPVETTRLNTTVANALEWIGIQNENQQLKEGLLTGHPKNEKPFASIITHNTHMLNLLTYAEVVAGSPKPVLITGESGTGKELLARGIHQAGPRAEAPYVVVNVAGLDDTMFSDTLFGHIRGAYTDAQTTRSGLIEQAANGTLVLDEMGELSPCNQIKLLRLLQENEYYRLGSDQPQKVRARFIAITNRDLKQRVRDGAFRADLYYRLTTHQLIIPPLRARTDDIPLLITLFIKKAAATLRVPPPRVSNRLFMQLCNNTYPGNVRELETLLFDAVTRYHHKGTIPNSLLKNREVYEHCTCKHKVQKGCHHYALRQHLPTLQQAREQLINEALERTDGNQAAAARMLGVSPQAISKFLLKKHQP